MTESRGESPGSAREEGTRDFAPDAVVALLVVAVLPRAVSKLDMTAHYQSFAFS